MIERIISNRYAKALLSTAEETNSIDKIDIQFDMFLNVLRDHPEIKTILTAPSINTTQKYVFINKILKFEWISDEFKSFLLLLIRKNRFALFEQICKIYKDLALFREKKLKVYASCAHKVSRSCDTALREMMAEIFTRNVQIFYREEPDLLAGIRLKIGPRVYDASLKRSIEQLRERF